MKRFKIAIIGATGLVGREFLNSLEKLDLVDELYLVASESSKGKPVKFGEETIKIISINESLEKEIDVAFFCAGSSISSEYAPKFAQKGVTVIDNSSFFRMNPEVPLIVPEVNGNLLKTYNGKIIANPNCSTIQLAVVLYHINKMCQLKRVVVSTYQSVSGAGQKGVDELDEQIKGFVKGKIPNPEVLPVSGDNKFYQMFNNCLPQIDLFEVDGYTKEEHKMINETRKILQLPKLQITVTTVRVPVFRSHSESVNIETFSDFQVESLKESLQGQPSIEVIDDFKNQGYPTPLQATGQNDVYVGRIRRDNSISNGLNLWIVADNVRKGAALNGLQILLYLKENNLL